MWFLLRVCKRTTSWQDPKVDDLPDDLSMDNPRALAGCDPLEPLRMGQQFALASWLQLRRY